MRISNTNNSNLSVRLKKEEKLNIVLDAETFYDKVYVMNNSDFKISDELFKWTFVNNKVFEIVPNITSSKTIYFGNDTKDFAETLVEMFKLSNKYIGVTNKGPILYFKVRLPDGQNNNNTINLSLNSNTRTFVSINNSYSYPTFTGTYSDGFTRGFRPVATFNLNGELVKVDFEIGN